MIPPGANVSGVSLPNSIIILGLILPISIWNQPGRDDIMNDEDVWLIPTVQRMAFQLKGIREAARTAYGRQNLGK